MPRFTPEAREKNHAFVELLGKFAMEKEVSPAQVALAWLLAQKPWIVPIPGTTHMQRMHENFDAEKLTLNAMEIAQILEASAQVSIEGTRYSAAAMEQLAKS